jgi:hypothetical protein
MAAVSGTWRDTAIYFDKPSPLHVADPRHDKIGHEPETQAYAYQAPPYPYAKPYGREDFGSQELIDTRGLQIDNSPDNEHDDGRQWGLAYTRVPDLDEPGGPDWDILGKVYVDHGKDQGASRKQNYSEKAPQFYDEQYLWFRVPGLGVEATDSIPSLAGGGGRGLNGLSVNNPPLESYLGRGFWPGTTEQWVVDRKFAARVIQRNDERAQTPNLPYFEANTPPPKPGNQVTSPFSGLQRMIGSINKIALARRTPPTPGDVQEEAVTEDFNSPTVEAAFYG